MLTQFERFKISKVLKLEGESTSIVARGEIKCCYDLSVWLECVIQNEVCELYVWGLCDYEDTEVVEITKGATDEIKLVIRRDSQ